MENASKALMIAGGILLALITLGLLIYVFSSLRTLPMEQEEQVKIEQLAKFNSEYESYNKQEMYGTDVITIINKAINNNKKYGASEKEYDIDVEITLKSNIISSATRYSTDNISGHVKTDELESGTVGGYKLGVVFAEKNSYNLLGTPDKNKDRINDVIANFIQGYETVKVDVIDSLNYTIVYSGFRDFKRRHFKCDGIEYSSITGRVNKLKFVEI